MHTTTHFTLNNGQHIPKVGLGCWMGKPGGVEACESMVEKAIRLGYRHFDTASGYRNETAVGKAVRESGFPRSEFFVTTKLWNADHGRVQEAFEESLARLGLEYIDLYLMHWPQAQTADGRIPQPHESPTYIETWKAMEKLVSTGKVKSIGVSNFSIKTLEVLLAEASIVPAVNQVHLNPCLPQNDLLAYCNSKGIHLTAYSPLGQINSPLHSDDDVTCVAKKYSVTPAQILLSWGVQRSTSVIPKSESEERLKANMSVPRLSNEDMKVIDDLHKKPGMHRQLFSWSNGHYAGGKLLTFGWTNEQLGWQLDNRGNYIAE